VFIMPAIKPVPISRLTVKKLMSIKAHPLSKR
jgi:hypothetical protein